MGASLPEDRAADHVRCPQSRPAFGIGLDTYWPQFAGLKNRLEGYLNQVHTRMESLGPDIVNVGLVDNVDKAFSAGHALRQADVDVIFLYVTTYALSSTVLPRK